MFYSAYSRKNNLLPHECHTTFMRLVTNKALHGSMQCGICTSDKCCVGQCISFTV